MNARRSASGRLGAPLAGLLVTLISLGLVRHVSRDMQAEFQEAARQEALAAANGAAHTMQIYFEERGAEAEYLATLCANGSVHSGADFLHFTHTIAESHGEYLGFYWRGAAGGPAWSHPAGRTAILPGGPPLIEAALRSLEGAPDENFPTRILVGRDPSSNQPIIGIMRPMRIANVPAEGVFYAECNADQLSQILTIPFYQGRFGYLVTAGDETIWSVGDPALGARNPGTRAELETVLFQERVRVAVWFLPGTGLDESKFARVLRMPVVLTCLLAGLVAAVLVEIARRAR
jgi:hypothetical protein